MVDLVERINVLIEQETSSYFTGDYLRPEYQDRLRDLDVYNIPSSCPSASTSTNCINEVWREKICEWSYQVIDYFDFSREVVSISLSYLDRFLTKRPVNKKNFQLLAMTCLFLAIKLHEQGTVSMKSMIDLSRGYFLVEHMAEMEMSILSVLSWKMHPPTANCFAKHFLFLLPSTAVPMNIRYDILELSRFLTELSVIDYFFVGLRQSVVALAALIFAMETIPGVSAAARSDLMKGLSRLQGLDPEGEDVMACRHRLQVLYVQGGYQQPDLGEGRDDMTSPVCVSHGVYPQSECNQPELHDHEQKDCNIKPTNDESVPNSWNFNVENEF